MLHFYILQGSVATQLRCGVCLVTTLLQIFHRMRQWKNFDNRSIFDKDMDKNLWVTFFRPPCIWYIYELLAYNTH